MNDNKDIEKDNNDNNNNDIDFDLGKEIIESDDEKDKINEVKTKKKKKN